MKPFFSLLKISLDSNFGISALKFRFTREKKKLWEPMLIIFSIILGLGSILALYSLLLTGVFAAGKSIGHPDVILILSFVFTQFIILFFGAFYVMGAFYFSKDFGILVPLPLKPYEVLGTKFLTVMCNEYITALPLMLPPILIYGIGMGQGFLYWVKGILLTLAVPSIPLAVGSLFVITLMRFVNLRRSKDLLAIVGGTLGLILAVSINILVQGLPKGNEADFLKNLLQSRTGLIDEIGRKFPPAIWATIGLSDPGASGWLNFLLFIAVSVLLFAFFLWLGNLIFYKGLLAGQETSSGKAGRISRKAAEIFGDETAAMTANSPVKALFIKEWRLLMRTPIYFLNGFMGNIIGPIIVIILFVVQRQSSSDTVQILQFIKDPSLIKYVTLGGLGFILFVAGMNTAASTTLSREGSTFWISKLIPVSAENQVLAKFFHGFAISSVGIVVTVAIMAIFIKLEMLRVAVVFVLGLVGAVSLVCVNMLFDVFHPKLIWTNPQEAIKQNMNALLGMAASLILVAFFAAATVALILLGASELLTYCGLAVIMGVAGAVSLKCLMIMASRKYRSLEA